MQVGRRPGVPGGEVDGHQRDVTGRRLADGVQGPPARGERGAAQVGRDRNGGTGRAGAEIDGRHGARYAGREGNGQHIGDPAARGHHDLRGQAPAAERDRRIGQAGGGVDRDQPAGLADVHGAAVRGDRQADRDPVPQRNGRAGGAAREIDRDESVLRGHHVGRPGVRRRRVQRVARHGRRRRGRPGRRGGRGPDADGHAGPATTMTAAASTRRRARPARPGRDRRRGRAGSARAPSTVTLPGQATGRGGTPRTSVMTSARPGAVLAPPTRKTAASWDPGPAGQPDRGQQLVGRPARRRAAGAAGVPDHAARAAREREPARGAAQHRGLDGAGPHVEHGRVLAALDARAQAAGGGHGLRDEARGGQAGRPGRRAQDRELAGAPPGRVVRISRSRHDARRAVADFQRDRAQQRGVEPGCGHRVAVSGGRPAGRRP